MPACESEFLCLITIAIEGAFHGRRRRFLESQSNQRAPLQWLSRIFADSAIPCLRNINRALRNYKSVALMFSSEELAK